MFTKKTTLTTLCFSFACMMVASTALADSPRPPCASDDDDCQILPDPDEPTQPPTGECSVDADCPTSWTCEVAGSYSCPSPPPGSDGDDEGCVGGEFSVCVPPPPKACDPSRGSADCDGSDVCVTYTFEECSGGDAPVCLGDGCPPTGPSPGDGQGSCTSKSESICVPKYLAPCQADADCGAGFKCASSEVCTGCAQDGGRPGVGSSDDGEEPSQPCELSCMPTGEKYCQLQEITCAADADCPSGLICEQIYSGGGSSTCSTDPDGNTDCTETPEPPGQRQGYCAPEDWRNWYGPGYSNDGGGSPRTSQEAVANATGNKGWSIKDAAPAPGQQPGGSAEPNASGCQAVGVGQAGSTASLSLLGLLGLIGLRRRKRA